MYTNGVFRTAKRVLLIEVSSFQDILNVGFHHFSVYSSTVLSLADNRSVHAGAETETCAGDSEEEEGAVEGYRQQRFQQTC